MNYDFDHVLADLLQASGTDAILQENGFSSDLADPSALTGMQISDFLETIISTVKSQIHAPLEMMGLLTGVLILSALAGSLRNQKPASQIFDVITVLCAAGTAVKPLTDIFLHSAEILRKAADFMLSFSAVFGGILTASGNLTASAGYQAAMIVLCNTALEIAVKILFPFLTMSLAMSLTDAVNPAVSLAGLIQMIQKMTVWILGFFMSLFLGFLSVQSVVATAADKVGTKAAKYAIAGFVPFIGGAVSDAYSAVLGSMNMLKSASGMIGVLAVLALLLPVLAELFLYKMLIGIAAAAAELLDASGLLRLFRNLESVLSAGFSVSVSFSIMFVISTGIMTTLGTA